MSEEKNVLILERSSDTLSHQKEENGEYVLEGVFGEIDTKNKNQRIYTESEYLPHIQALQEKIEKSKLLGELDHPAQFDVSLKNVSHIIESLYYDKENKQVRGRIRLLNTEQGQQAKALVDANVPLHISSRAAGRVKNNNEVELQELFTYDLVADPGFESAELNKVNESLGINNNNILIYEMNNDLNEKDTNKENQTKNNNMSEENYVKTGDFHNYTQYLSKEVKELKEEINSIKNQSNVSEGNGNELNEEVNKKFENIVKHNNHLAKTINKISEHVEKLTEKIDQNIQYTEHVALKAKENVDFSKQLEESINNTISYAEKIAEKANNNIDNTNNLNEDIENLKKYANVLAESNNNNVKSINNLKEYTSHIKENVEYIGEYTDYISNIINENLVDPGAVGKSAKHPDDFENATKVNQLNQDKENQENSKDMPKNVDDEGAGKHPDNFAGVRQAKYSEDDKGVTKQPDKQAPEQTSSGPAKNVVENYKEEISSKLDTIINESKNEKNKNPHFFKIVSKETQDLYNNLSEDAKTKVRESIPKHGFMTESQIKKMIENAEKVNENANEEPYFIKAMPEEFKETWEKLSENKKNEIHAQAKYRDLKTEYQVRDFWQTRDLIELNEKVNQPDPTSVNEQTTKDNQKSNTKLGYDPTQFKEDLKSRFNK